MSRVFQRGLRSLWAAKPSVRQSLNPALLQISKGGTVSSRPPHRVKIRLKSSRSSRKNFSYREHCLGRKDEPNVSSRAPPSRFRLPGIVVSRESETAHSTLGYLQYKLSKVLPLLQTPVGVCGILKRKH